MLKYSRHNSGQVATVRDIVLIAVGGALWLALSILTAVFTAFPGFFLVSLPILLSGIYSVWFGKKGIIMGVLGLLLQDVQKGITPIVAWGDYVGVAFVVMTLLWLLLPAGYAELKTAKQIGVYYGLLIPLMFVGFFIVILGFTIMGIIPGPAFTAVYLGVMLGTGSVQVVADFVLLRSLTPFIKRSGLYSGTRADQRMRSKQPVGMTIPPPEMKMP